MAEIGADLARAEALLRASELVAVPTETVYGLAGNALDPEAILRIYEAKGRPRFNPLIAHVASLDHARAWITGLPEAALTLGARFWPGPLTLLLPRNARVPDLCTAGSPRVALRVPDHPLTLALLRRLDFPLAAPSANPSGYISPTTAQHVDAQLGDRVPYILDGGPTAVGLESTILGFDDDGAPRLFRLGGLPLAAIEAAVGPVRRGSLVSDNPQAPGQLSSHYAPRTRLVLGHPAEDIGARDPRSVGVLAFREGLPQVPAAQQRVLSPSGDLREAARGLFSAMRALDGLGLELILAERFPAQGLGEAINDRLARAAVPAVVSEVVSADRHTPAT